MSISNNSNNTVGAGRNSGRAGGFSVGGTINSLTQIYAPNSSGNVAGLLQSVNASTIGVGSSHNHMLKMIKKS
jgi:hypothetical protein